LDKIISKSDYLNCHKNTHDFTGAVQAAPVFYMSIALKARKNE
jgi:hypothetical protein